MPNLIESLVKKYTKQKEEFTNKIEKDFKLCCDEIFQRYPSVESFSWTQYTPYFNDGETCEFSVNTSCNVNEIDEYDLEKGSPEEQASEEISDLIGAVPEEIMKDLFGDHVEVTVHRDGKVEVADYEHD